MKDQEHETKRLEKLQFFEKLFRYPLVNQVLIVTIMTNLNALGIYPIFLEQLHTQ